MQPPWLQSTDVEQLGGSEPPWKSWRRSGSPDSSRARIGANSEQTFHHADDESDEVILESSLPSRSRRSPRSPCGTLPWLPSPVHSPVRSAEPPMKEPESLDGLEEVPPQQTSPAACCNVCGSLYRGAVCRCSQLAMEHPIARILSRTREVRSKLSASALHKLEHGHGQVCAHAAHDAKEPEVELKV